MRVATIQLADQSTHLALIEEKRVRMLDLMQVDNCHNLADLLHSPDPIGLAKYLIDQKAAPIGIEEVNFRAPVDRQEIWAAGVTYKRSQVARMEESDTAASHYDRVYTADRPELFFKATPSRVSGPGEPVRVRFDSGWSVPEPELALMVSPEKKLVGLTIGNDMSARDIEGENPLYLPQAKFYNQCCGLGPCVLIPEEPIDRAGTSIVLSIKRGGNEVFSGETNVDQMARSFEDLISWLGKENDFPHGAILLTGTGIVPPDEFTLEHGDEVAITITGIGTLVNPVVKD
ncbi:Fumarylacetoacetate (FAA) hydrolase family protein [Symmachiella dynata]|uniref:Fumarylacetoacetate (FAA) hydrolase family protein n=1 Tax=Symmachiella dynata TaxID=2527995 RepID=A0A517ZKP2_9PLAN|nr:fumarylacetoacetate hydrolase family protein [Symmachiella dynata]QDU43026.1 Fumarylacetoacetate (FAA) hydrolase family protein [Symmachiella dynata]